MASRSAQLCIHSQPARAISHTAQPCLVSIAKLSSIRQQPRLLSYFHSCVHKSRTQPSVSQSHCPTILQSHKRSLSNQTIYRKQAVTTQDDPTDQSRITTTKRKSQKPASLRRVAAEAQYTRDGFIRRSGNRRYVDPDAETKQVTAYCAAEQYSIPVARRLLIQEGYRVDPFNTGLYPQVIHVQTPDIMAKDPATGEDRRQGPGDVFVFPSGSIVTWNAPEQLQHDLVHRILLPAAESPHLETVEIEDLEYLEDSTKDVSRIIGETIILGTKATNTTAVADAQSETSSSTSSGDASSTQTGEVDAVLAKIAFSSGLARSTKLAVLENLLASYFESTRSISTILSRGSKLRFTRSFILRKTGELLSIRAQLNLYSELTDELPDLFWDSPSSLGLSDYYDQVGRALDVNSRIRILNEKIGYAGEIATVLRERLSEKHSTDLEWLIIFLISVEVVFELWRIWRERMEMADPDSTESLLKEYLLRERSRHELTGKS